MTNPNFKQINVDIQTHKMIKNHADHAHRSVAGEVRELCSIVYGNKLSEIIEQELEKSVSGMQSGSADVNS